MMPQLQRMCKLSWHNITPFLHQHGYPNWRCNMWRSWMGGLIKTYLFNQGQSENPNETINIHHCPKIHLWIPLENPNIVVVAMWNPMAHSISFTLGSSILDELEFKSSMGLHLKTHESVKNSTRLIGLLVEVQPYWPPFPFFVECLENMRRWQRKECQQNVNPPLITCFLLCHWKTTTMRIRTPCPPMTTMMGKNSLPTLCYYYWCHYYQCLMKMTFIQREKK